jgi:hypothetical protein
LGSGFCGSGAGVSGSVFDVWLNGQSLCGSGADRGGPAFDVRSRDLGFHIPH